tara:strand:+ start:2784 stop:2918 length:135 start_codon:yes stop_codon:yes gene_type:complete
MRKLNKIPTKKRDQKVLDLRTIDSKRILTNLFESFRETYKIKEL